MSIEAEIKNAVAEAVGPLHDDIRKLQETIASIQPAPEWVPLAEYARIRGVKPETDHEWRKAGSLEVSGTPRKYEVRLNPASAQ